MSEILRELARGAKEPASDQNLADWVVLSDICLAVLIIRAPGSGSKQVGSLINFLFSSLLGNS